MVKVTVKLYLLIVPNFIFQTELLAYQKFAPFASRSDKLEAINELHRAGWCKNNFPHFWSKEFWPPSLSDIVFGSFWKRKLVLHPIFSVKALKVSLKKAWDKLPQETLHKAVDRIRCRHERVMKAGRRPMNKTL